MLTKFPLYESLNINTTDKAILLKNKKKLIELISHMDNTGKELIYALIKYHSLKIPTDTNMYNCETQPNDDLKLYLDDLPNRLQQILLKFAEKEQYVQQETKNREAIEIKMKLTNEKNKNK